MRRAPNIPDQDGRLTGELGRAIDASHQSTRALPPFLQGEGRNFHDLEWTTGESKRIKHGLGRAPRGVLVYNVQAASATSGVLREVRATRSKTSLFIVNDAGVAVTASVWVF